MRDPRLETKAQTFAGPGLSRKTEIVCAFWVAFPRRQVNLSGLSFRLRPIAGLSLAGGWLSLLTLWCSLLDMAAKVLRAVAEGRI